MSSITRSARPLARPVEPWSLRVTSRAPVRVKTRWGGWTEDQRVGSLLLGPT